jgi:hypothetical protein
LSLESESVHETVGRESGCNVGRGILSFIKVFGWVAAGKKQVEHDSRLDLNSPAGLNIAILRRLDVSIGWRCGGWLSSKSSHVE